MLNKIMCKPVSPCYCSFSCKCTYKLCVVQYGHNFCTVHVMPWVETTIALHMRLYHSMGIGNTCVTALQGSIAIHMWKNCEVDVMCTYVVKNPIQ